jgi:DNA-binding NarL/FixJ family response regulator
VEKFVPPSCWSHVAAVWTELLRNGALTGENSVIRADGSVVRVHDAARREIVTGRQLVLYVVLEVLKQPPPREHDAAHPPARLSAREIQVVSELAMGHRVREIAEKLVIAPTTAQTHVRNAMTKLGARSQAQLVAIALADGLLDDEVVMSHA